MRKVYETLGLANDSGSPDTYVVYSDPVDTAQNYPESNLKKYCGNLRDSGQCLLAAEEDPSGFTRGEGTPNISGTKVRRMLEMGDFEGFSAAMPAGVDGQNIFNILTKKAQNENVLRAYIKTILA